MTRELLSNKLLEWMRTHARVAVAFSGGVDSTVVAAAAFRALGTNAIAVTGLSPSLAEREQADCVRLARQIGIKHLFLPTYEFEQDAYRVNDHRRCYFCKNELYRVIHSMRDVLSFDVICSGTNADDLGDYRPGLEAAAEHQVKHPLADLGITKDQVRELALHWQLDCWDKPAAPCLSSRLATGVEANEEHVALIEAGESLLRAHGFQTLRLRMHPGMVCRIEVPADQIGQALSILRATPKDSIGSESTHKTIVEQLKDLGFRFITLDVSGFKSGSLNILHGHVIQ